MKQKIDFRVVMLNIASIVYSIEYEAPTAIDISLSKGFSRPLGIGTGMGDESPLLGHNLLLQRAHSNLLGLPPS
ncbi:MAG: hypothetical protein ACYCPP_05440 [Nitrososphaerales archaeon]